MQSAAKKAPPFLSGGALFPKTSISKKITDFFTVRYQTVGEEPRFVFAYRELPDGSLVLPRSTARFFFEGYAPEVSYGQPVSFIKEITLWEAQVPIVDSIIANGRAANIYDFVVKSPTGSGKTTMALSAIAALGRTALIVVDQQNLADQWRERIKTFLGCTDDEIGTIQGPKCEFKDKKITIAMLQSLSQRQYEDDLYSNFGVVVFDECFHPSHELLTPAGWKSIQDIVLQDMVAQVDGTTGEITFVHPDSLVKNNFNGDLVRFENGNTDLLATPNHQHLVYWRDESTPQKVAYGDLHPGNRWTHRQSGHAPGESHISAWDRLRVAYQADGMYLRFANKKQEHSIRFSFRKKRKIDRLITILEQIEGARWKVSVNSRGDTSIAVWLKVNVEKSLLWIPLNESAVYYRELLEEIVEWDGWTQTLGSTKFYESAGLHNAERVQAIASLAGFTSNLKIYQRIKHNHSNKHRVSWFGRAVKRTHGLRKMYVPYSGYVYCVSVPSGNVLTRRNNKITVTGNCHTSGAPVVSSVLLQFNAKTRFGISATPKRRDALQKIIDWNLGTLLIESAKKHKESSVYYVESPTVYSWYANVSPKTGRIISEIAEDAERNLKLANVIKSLYGTGRDILVISDRTEHLSNLLSLCFYLGLPEDTMGLYTGVRSVWRYEKDPTPKYRIKGAEKDALYTPIKFSLVSKKTKKADLEHVMQNCRIIFATYGMFTKGVDLPRLSAGVDCTPRSQAEQVHGRILREKSGKLSPIWVTFLDTGAYRTNFQFSQRILEYKKSNAKIYQWDFSKGIRERSIESLRIQSIKAADSLKAAKIVQQRDGRNILVF